MKTLAKILRGITVPPVMVALLFGFLYCARTDVVPTATDLWLSLLFFAVIPALAYPLQMIVPALRPGGQQMRRKLAFVFSLVGYSAALIVSLARGAVPNLAYVDAVYLSSVVVLTLINLLTPWRASGHACSLVGPVALLCCFFGVKLLLPAVLVIGLSLWSALYLKRHTVKEFALGAAASLSSLLLMYPVFLPVF
jgi:hypothetical protein